MAGAALGAEDTIVNREKGSLRFRMGGGHGQIGKHTLCRGQKDFEEPNRKGMVTQWSC